MKLHIKTGNNNYPILFTDSFSSIQDHFQNVNFSPTSICIVTDENVDELYYNEVYKEIAKSNNKIIKYIIKPGEKYKTLETVEKIISHCVDNKLGRDSAIIALGGGVVGDIAGFVASIYTRGIKFIQIPTTLLAQNDSSVGGKVGVDFKGHKNMVGSFYQPELVYINTQVLSTLNKKEFSSGMAEIIKHALIMDKDFKEFLVENAFKINTLNSDVIAKMNYISCSIKGMVVSKDEKEGSIRKILNFGHTIGHSIETLSNFEYSHGYSVSLGIVAASYISLSRSMITITEFDLIQKILRTFNLPIKLRKQDLNSEEVYKQLFYDKKVKDNKLIFILLNSIGNCTEVDNVTKKEILDSIEYLQKEIN